MSTLPSVLDELAWRGLLYQQTDGAGAALAAGAVTGYCGFDPTAPSLHVGSLVPIMALVHLQRAGHRPIALAGGGTGLIGDPSGKGTERPLSSPDVVAENTEKIRAQLARFLDFSGGGRGALLVDNAAWLRPLGAIELLRDVGKHFTVNYMMAKESVKGRLESGISFTEFAYQLLQAYDFLELHRRHGATLQIGGSDQWGNIVSGVELIRRTTGAEAHGVTLPLVTTAAGTKFGKTEAGAVWLDGGQTSPYKFYQFWVNTDDRDVGRYLRFYTLLGREEVEGLDAQAAEHPERREAQRALAREVTARVHGAEAVRVAEEASALLFGKGDPAGLSEAALAVLEGEIPFAVVPRPEGDQGIDVVPLFAQLGLTKSNGETRRLMEQGGLSANGRRLTTDDRLVRGEQLIHGRYILLKKGARQYGLVRVE